MRTPATRPKCSNCSARLLPGDYQTLQAESISASPKGALHSAPLKFSSCGSMLSGMPNQETTDRDVLGNCRYRSGSICKTGVCLNKEKIEATRCTRTAEQRGGAMQVMSTKQVVNPLVTKSFVASCWHEWEPRARLHHKVDG
jgi:hypothetical protein